MTECGELHPRLGLPCAWNEGHVCRSHYCIQPDGDRSWWIVPTPEEIEEHRRWQARSEALYRDAMLELAEARRHLWKVDEFDAEMTQRSRQQISGSDSEFWVLIVIFVCIALIPIGLLGYAFIAGMMGVQ